MKGKTFIVTGGGNGMGREIVLGLLRKGNNVIAADISRAALEETRSMASDAPGDFSYFVIDITDRESVTAWAGELCSELLVDGIINNAGVIQPFTRISDTGYDVAERIFNVNFWGTFNMTHAFLPYLINRPEAYIVNVSSMGGFLPVPGQAIYGASKAAVKLFSESLDSELHETNVHVTTVFPGAMDTEIRKHSGLDEPETRPEASAQNRPLSPRKAAEQVISAIEEGLETVYVGEDSIAMDRLYRKDPELAVRKISSMIKHAV